MLYRGVLGKYHIYGKNLVRLIAPCMFFVVRAGWQCVLFLQEAEDNSLRDCLRCRRAPVIQI